MLNQRGLVLALTGVVGGTTQCSLLAPSDVELMGGNRSADAADSADSGSDGDASSGMSSSGSGSSGGACGHVGDCCVVPGDCCASLLCETNSGVCMPCVAAGGSCSPAEGLCCSGSCAGHTCK
jgi:hypothetical protein